MNLWSSARREIKFLNKLLRTLGRVRKIDARPNWLVCDELEHGVDRWGDNDALRAEDGALTYRQLDRLANAAARWAALQGLQRGDAVAIVLPNRIEYGPLWLGLSKIGVIGALINNHLEGPALAHCVSISGARHVITDASCLGALDAIGAGRTMRLWSLDLDPRAAHLKFEANVPRPARALRAGMTNKSTALLIYTSGTTGMPKAARVTHARALLYMLGFAGATGARASDTIFSALPLYHATGGVAALGAALFTGACFAHRRKFSASQFWEDVARENATMFVYIGELCRYLVNQPPHEKERAHKIRQAFGNGLRPEVWGPFQERFAIRDVLEFYGSTEGNVSMFNFDGAPGAIGRVPFYLKSQFNISLVKLDLETEQPIRGPGGLCQPCKPGEIGETVGRIGADARSNYTGYVDRAASEKKIIRDVFKKGDAWFRTGDLMRQDEGGYFYFVDRLGDTFRWKGENVSTTEVAAALSACGIAEANVYGVAIPGYDGRAGMAALITHGEPDLVALHACSERSLPSYARPLFLRLQPEFETTGTFKYRKIDLVREGFDPAAMSEPIYFDHPHRKAYVPLTAALHGDILSGAIRL